MVYAYVRVSTDSQIVDNQKFIIGDFCKQKQIAINGWIEETISGTKDYQKRLLGKKLKRNFNSGDILLCTELSRLGRNLFMIMDILNYCMRHDIKVWTIKENYRLGDDIQSKVLAFAFGISAEIERNLISLRTKESLQRLKAQGKKLGRPFGSKNAHLKGEGKEKYIKSLLAKGISKKKIAKRLKIHPNTLTYILKRINCNL